LEISTTNKSKYNGINHVHAGDQNQIHIRIGI
jgi:hypothetical protein